MSKKPGKRTLKESEETRASGAAALEVLRGLQERLHAAGFPQPQMEMRELLQSVCGGSALDVLCGARKLTPENETRLKKLLERREAGEPLAYLTGRTDFCGFELEVSQGVFIAREDTETLIDALRKHKKSARRVLDLGTGTGALAIAAAATYPSCKVDAVERSPEALQCASLNIQRYGLGQRVRLIPMDYLREDWSARLQPPYTAILANPPYVALSSRGDLPREVLREPAEALFSGEDGLDAPRFILKHALAALEPGGLLIMEIGDGQLDTLRREADDLGWTFLEARPDATGNPRALTLQKPA